MIEAPTSRWRRWPRCCSSSARRAWACSSRRSPRGHPAPVQCPSRSSASLGALVATCAGRRGHETTAAGALAVDGAALFLQATIAGLGALSILLFAERALDPARSAFVTSAAVPWAAPGTANS